MGKTTQCRLLQERLEALGWEVVPLREPTHGPWGQKIREAARTDTRPDPQTEAEWFMHDRREDVEQNIRPALADGKVVILDRYFYSTAAYQGARNVDVDWILEANREFAPEPNVCIVLLGDVEKALQRVSELRGDTPDAFETAEYQRRVVAVFRDLLGREDCDLVEVDADRSITEVAVAVWAAVTTSSCLASGGASEPRYRKPPNSLAVPT